MNGPIHSTVLSEREILELIDQLPGCVVDEFLGDDVNDVVSAKKAAHGGELVIGYERP